MSLSAPDSPPRRPSLSIPSSFSVSPSLLRIAGILPDRARSLTPSNMRIRKRMPEHSTIEDAVDLIRDSDNIVVLAGAGISTSVGIPDFRSAQGLYNQVKTKRNFQDPQQLFEADTFLTQPREFWEDVQPIIPKLITAVKTGSAVINTVPKFGTVHAFLNLLDSKEKLRQIFTQNIDGLERAAGVDNDLIIKCHGSWDTATCITCKATVDANQYLPIVHNGNLPLCSCAKPTAPSTSSDAAAEQRKTTRPRKESLTNVNVEYLESQAPVAVSPVKPISKPLTKKRKRRDSDDESDASVSLGRPGLLKPDITFFSEGISSKFRPAVNKIKLEVDLLIIVGTSLPVEPVNLLPFDIPAEVPQIWISNERCKREGLAVDVQLIGDCNLVVEELCRQAGWTNGLLNRLWKNNYGSNLQAKEALRARNQATVAANAAVKDRADKTEKTEKAEKAEKAEELSLRPAPSMEGKPATEKPPEMKKDKEKPKKVAESKVKIEEVLGYDNLWSVKALSA